MNYSFYDLLTLIGALGLFLYGMKMMSEGLQKIAGDRLRGILAAMTANRVMGIFTGALITVLIQSSSATTVMVVSFVNAGLLTLTQAISVIMGANIGTTVTAWIISLFGFKFSISALSIPLIGISIPLIFSSKGGRKSWGEFLIGFALLFMGLDFLKDSVPDLKQNPEMLAFLQNWTGMGYLSVIIFVLVGTVVTILVQSSSATMAITLIMCSMGWIPFHIAAAMVMGENIGTTITANLAALTANVSARRAALSHMLFNVFGVCWLLIFFYPFVNLVTNMVELLGSSNPLTMEVSNPDYQLAASYSLSLFHTMFNIINTFIMLWFVNLLAKLVTKVIPSKSNDEEFTLKFISTGMLSTAELALIQAHKEIQVYAERTHRMFDMVKVLYSEQDEESFLKLFARIEKYEQISDRMEIEIANYLSRVSEELLSKDSKIDIHLMMRTITEIESIDDSCYNLARAISRRNKQKATFNKHIDAQCNRMFALLTNSLEAMQVALSKNEYKEVDINNSLNIEREINLLRNNIKLQNLDDINNKIYPYEVGVVYMDIIVECEKLGDYVINVVEAASHQQKGQ